MKPLILFLLVLGTQIPLFPQSSHIELKKDKYGWKLLVSGKPFAVNGMNWDYFPIGTNYSYNIWDESDEFIEKALDYEMTLLKNMGVNAIRVYTGIQPRWVQYIFENHGIYTMLNHSFGRYGYTLDAKWIGNTDYSDPNARTFLLSEVRQIAQEFKGTPGLLLYLLGNENNYGLFWGGAETENMPVDSKESAQRARYLYTLFNEAAIAMKEIDPDHPVALCNGDLMFLDIIAETCQDVDIFGVNVYRGKSFNDLFDRVKNEYGKPVLLTEFGSDAFHAITMEEAQKEQAIYKVANWKEIYENTAGFGQAGNSIGGFTFQFSDGWWKYGQTFNLDVHDTHASWSNGGYLFDYSPGETNMNEEWFGICAKGPTDGKGFYPLYPRAAYYALKEVHKLNPYAEGMRLQMLQEHFENIDIENAYVKATEYQMGNERKHPNLND
jgi:hypothetical protein